jgi:hypothetical protein
VFCFCPRPALTPPITFTVASLATLLYNMPPSREALKAIILSAALALFLGHEVNVHYWANCIACRCAVKCWWKPEGAEGEGIETAAETF